MNRVPPSDPEDQKDKPDRNEPKISFTVDDDNKATLKVPHTEKGRQLIQLLHEVFETREMPFQQVERPPQQGLLGNVDASESAAKPGSGGSTSYALDMRIEQEGWPP